MPDRSCDKPNFKEKLASLLQLVDKSEQARKIDNLQQLCAVFICVPDELGMIHKILLQQFTCLIRETMILMLLPSS